MIECRTFEVTYPLSALEEYLSESLEELPLAVLSNRFIQLPWDEYIVDAFISIDNDGIVHGHFITGDGDEYERFSDEDEEFTTLIDSHIKDAIGYVGSGKISDIKGNTEEDLVFLYIK